MSYYEEDYYEECIEEAYIYFDISLLFYRKDGKEMTADDHNAIKAEMKLHGYGIKGFDFEEITSIICPPDETCEHQHIATSYEGEGLFEFDSNSIYFMDCVHNKIDYKEVVRQNWRGVELSPEFSEVYDYDFEVDEAEV